MHSSTLEEKVRGLGAALTFAALAGLHARWRRWGRGERCAEIEATMADELLQMFQSITTSDHDELVDQFAYLLQVDSETAAFFLESSNWNVETAVNMYLGTMEAQDGGSYFSSRPAPVAAAPSDDLDMDDGDGTPAPVNDFANAPVDLQAHFISDLSQSQSMLFAPGASINMQWTYVNTGSTPWPAGTALVFAQGSSFNAPEHVPVSAAPGERIDIHAALQLPDAAGSYAGSWRLRSPQGFFGDPVWVILNVGDGSTSGMAHGQPPQGVAMGVNPLDPSKIQQLQAGAPDASVQPADGAGFPTGIVEDMDL